MRYREPLYPDAAHSRPLHRKDFLADPTVYPSVPPKNDPESNVFRNNYSVEDVVQYPHAKYERWIPSTQPSPPSRQQEQYHRERDRHERDREKDKQRHREELYRERRDERERYKSKYDGESDWDKEREKRDRREKERIRELDRERVRDQERRRAREEYIERAGDRIIKEKARGTEGYRDEREQERYTENERQKAFEKEKGRERERDRERRRQKEKERERQDREKYEDPRPRVDLERERKRERELIHADREHLRDVDKARESDREFERRKKGGDGEQKERERVKENSNRIGERGNISAAIHEGRRREVEHEGSRKVQEPTRRHQPVIVDESGAIPVVIREQDIERIRRIKKDADSSRQKEYERMHKASEQVEAERVHYPDKENVLRHEHKSQERTKRSGDGRSYADRATDSERENPSHRDIVSSNAYSREANLRGFVEPNVATKPPTISKQARDDRSLYVIPEIHSSTTKAIVPESMPVPDTSRPVVGKEEFAGHVVPTSRSIDQTLSATPKYSPISVTTAESPKLDVSASEAKTKQGSSSQRALRRQSKMSNLVPEQIAILPPLHTASKSSQPQVTSNLPSDTVPPRPPSSHAFRSDKEDTTRFYPAQAQGLVDSLSHRNPLSVGNSANVVVLTKVDSRAGTSSIPVHRTTSSSLNNSSVRSFTRNSNAHLPSTYEKPTIESSNLISSIPREPLEGISASDVQTSAGRLLGDDAKGIKPPVNPGDDAISFHSIRQASSEHVAPRPILRDPSHKTGKHFDNGLDTSPPMQVLPHSTSPAVNLSSITNMKTSSRSTVKAPNTISSIVTETEMKAAVERIRAGPQPGLLAMSSLGIQQEDSKREKGMVTDRTQNLHEVPPRRPPSVIGWSTLQESAKDKVTTTPLISNSHAAEPAPISIEPSTSIDDQRTSAINAQLQTSVGRQTNSFHIAKQEGLLAPIPENTSVVTSIRPPPSARVDASLQHNMTVSDKHGPLEPSAPLRMHSRSISDSAGSSSTPITKTPSSKTAGDEGLLNRKMTVGLYTSNIANAQNVEPLPLSQNEDKMGHNAMTYSQEDRLHIESLQSHSPASLRRNSSVQPSLGSSNTVDRPEMAPNGQVRSQMSNRIHSSSSANTGEELVVTYSLSSRPNEEMHPHGSHHSVGQQPGRPDVSAVASSKDSYLLAQTKNDAALGVVQHADQEPDRKSVV